ncbi:MAG: helix-turn-helix domain-containing protein [Bacteroidota bacterium]
MKPYQIKPIDVAEKAISVLKTVLLLDKAYSASYLMRLLKGDEQYPLKDEAHKQLETFGVLAEDNFSQIEGLIYYLQKQAYLCVKDESFGNIEASELATEFLGKPKPMLANRRQLTRSWLEAQLHRELRELRKELSESMEVLPYELYNNYAMHLLSTQMPATLEELNAIPAAFTIPDACKLMVLNKIEAARELKVKDERSGGLYTKAHSPSHQAVLRLCEEGCSLEEIAAARSIKPATVRSYLTNLHRTEQLDLSLVIEENLDEKILHRGVEYFSQSGDGRLKTAHESLGIDYESLHWCKLYHEIRGSEPVEQAA